MQPHFKVSKGIFLLPSLLTTLGSLAGFYAIVSAMNGNFILGAKCIFIAMLFDGIDGRAARLTNTTTNFGAQYDSMADLISFGVAPAILIYQWSLGDLDRLGWLIAFFYMISCALRLSRFNVQIASTNKNYFRGLPSPTAAGLIAGFVWTFNDIDLFQNLNEIAAAVITSFVGILMISNIRYAAFKEINIKNKIPFVMLVIVVLAIVLVTIEPKIVLLSTLFAYTIHGIFITIIGLKQARKRKRLGNKNI